MSYKYKGGKLRRWDKLSKDEQADLLFDLLSAFTLLKTTEDAAAFITDLLTSDEVKFLSKRLRIAKMILADSTYRDIETKLRVSHSTIAKVAVWLQEKGEGFRKIVKNIPQRKKVKLENNYSGWEKYKGVNVGKVWDSLAGDSGNTVAKMEEENLHKTLKTLSSKDAVRRRVHESYEEEFKSKKRKNT